MLKFKYGKKVDLFVIWRSADVKQAYESGGKGDRLSNATGHKF